MAPIRESLQSINHHTNAHMKFKYVFEEKERENLLNMRSYQFGGTGQEFMFIVCGHSHWKEELGVGWVSYAFFLFCQFIAIA